MAERSYRRALSFVVLFLIARGTEAAHRVPAGVPSPREMFSTESLHSIARSVIADEEARRVDAPPRAHSYRPYWIVYAWLTAATVYDVESTFYLLDRCRDCTEQNPIVKPFIDRGRFATYAYSAAVNGVIMYVARRMYDRSDGLWRFFPIAVAVVHAIAGTWNIYEGARLQEAGEIPYSLTIPPYVSGLRSR